MLISVIVPSYNHSAFLRACLRSVATQTYRPVELIVVDDGSTDNSRDVIRAFNNEFKNVSGLTIRSFFKKNGGAHDAINFGVRKARGELIAILNSDDLFHPDRLTLLAKPILKRKTEFSMSLVSFIDQNARPVRSNDGRCAWYAPKIAARYAQPSLSLVIFISHIHLTSGNFLFTRRLFDRLGGFRDYRWAHDYDFLLRATLLTEPVLISRRLLSYRYHGANTIGSIPANWARFIHEARIIFEDYLENAAVSHLKRKNINQTGATPYTLPEAFRDLYLKASFFAQNSFVKELSLCSATLVRLGRKNGGIEVGEYIRPFLRSSSEAADALGSLPYMNALHSDNFSQREDAGPAKCLKISKTAPVLFDRKTIGSLIEIKAQLKPSYDKKLLLAGAFLNDRLLAVLRFHESAGGTQILRGFSNMRVDEYLQTDLKICWLDFEHGRFICRWPTGALAGPKPRVPRKMQLLGGIEKFEQTAEYLLIEGWAVIDRELPEKIEWVLGDKTIDVLPQLYSRPDLAPLLANQAVHKIAGFRFIISHPVRTAAGVWPSKVNVFFADNRFELPVTVKAKPIRVSPRKSLRFVDSRAGSP